VGACRTSSDIPLRKSAHLYIFEKKADRIDFSGHHRQRKLSVGLSFSILLISQAALRYFWALPG